MMMEYQRQFQDFRGRPEEIYHEMLRDMANGELPDLAKKGFKKKFNSEQECQNHISMIKTVEKETGKSFDYKIENDYIIIKVKEE